MTNGLASIALAGLLLWAPRSHANEAGPEASRTVVSFAANAFMPSAGLELSRGVSDHFSVAAQLTTLLIAHNDLSVRTRAYLFPLRRGPYLGASAHLIHSPLILSFPAVAGAAELGYEWLTSGQWRFAIGGGAGLLWAESSEGGDGGWMPWPLFNLRIGR